MKALLVITLLVLSWTIPAGAWQNSAQSLDPPGLSIIEKSWHKEINYPERDPNPLGPNEDYEKQVRAQKETIKRREENPKLSTEESIPFVTPPPLATRMTRNALYVYRVKVQNTGTKTIQTIVWEYQFLDPDTQKVMGHLQTTSRVKISPDKFGELEHKSSTRPTAVVNADQLNKKSSDQFKERIVIHRIDFTDGSVWRFRK